MAPRPPLNALYTFCAVVRAGGFRPAAQALHVTPGAVSKQVRVLEEHLKEVLFDRTEGGMASPTPAGLRLYQRVTNEIEAIAEALRGRGRAARRASLLVDTSVTLAMYWLIPMLKRFNERHPGIQVQVRTSDGAINPAAPVDVFIRRDPAELCGLAGRAFMAEHSVLVGAPGFHAGLPARRATGMGWLAKMPRIGTRSRPDLWPRWSEANGLRKCCEPTLEYDNTILAIQAALQGMGALCVPEVFVADMVESGALTLLAPRRIETGSYSYAIGRRKDSAGTRAFTEWLAQYGEAPEDR